MIEPRHPVRGRKGRVVFHRERAPLAEELARLTAARQRAKRTTWSHIREVEVILLEGNAPERVVLSWLVEGPDPSGEDPAALAELVSRIMRALPGSKVLFDDPLALFSQHGARVIASPTKGSRPDRLPTGWVPRPGSILHRGQQPRGLAPPGTPGQLLDMLGVLDVSANHDFDVVSLSAGAALHPRFSLRNSIQQGTFAAAGLRALAALARARIIPPTGLPELALLRLEDGDYRERQAARELLAAVDEPAAPPARTGRPRLAGVGQAVREAWEQVGPSLGGRRTTFGPEAELHSGGRSRVRHALYRVLPPILPPSPDTPWLGRPPERSLPYLTRAEKLDQVLRSEASDRRTGGLALLAFGGPLDGTPPGCFDATVAILDSPRSSPLDASLAALALGCSLAPEATRRLARAVMEWPDPDVASAAAEALAGQAGPIAREALRDALTLPQVAPVAAEAASKIGDIGALEGILALADHSDASIRNATARALARIGTGPDVIAVLERLSNDPSPMTARSARASRAIHRGRKELEAWVPRASATDLAAAMVLLGRRDRVDAWTVLVQGLRHPSPDVRASAAAGLGWLGLPGATPALVRLLSDEQPAVIVSACLALARCGDSRAVAPLRVLANGTETANLAAQQALRSGCFLRTHPPDSHIYLRALAPSPLPLEVAGRLTSALHAPGLRCRVSAAGVHGEATVDPDDILSLLRIAAVLDQASEACPDLRWSVRDGQHAIRRHGRRWTVSRNRGRVIRDAGWHEEPRRPTPSRPPLEAHAEDDLFLDGPEDDLVLGEDLLLDESDDLQLDEDIELEAPVTPGLAGITTGASVVEEATSPG